LFSQSASSYPPWFGRKTPAVENKFPYLRDITLEAAKADIIDLVERHVAKDWGDLSDDDKRLNDDALHDGSRILSAYILPTDVKIWIITEATDGNGERTALFREEY
jgi:hypothetical protein